MFLLETVSFSIAETVHNESLTITENVASQNKIFNNVFEEYQFGQKKISRHRMLSQADKTKSSKLARAANALIKGKFPKNFKPEIWSHSHRLTVPYAVFSTIMWVTMKPHHVVSFAGTLRKVGFDGDIVLAMEPGTEREVVDKFISYQTIVYNVSTSCIGKKDRRCSIYSMNQYYSINLMRFFLYRWWASQYSHDTYIMISDFRDVFFQSNPFLYKPEQWAPPAAQLVVFQEAHPNAVINRCGFNSGWIRSCYGAEALEKIGHNTVSCSGVSMGTRDGIILYSFIMTEQVEPKNRLGADATESDNQRCVSAGMDQGFHNWMIYSGMLDKYMNIRIFQQGEGPVNTMGGFFGERKLLKFSLEKWGVLQGKPPNVYVANWNGDRSPAIHQLDRWRDSLVYRHNMYGKLDVFDKLRPK